MAMSFQGSGGINFQPEYRGKTGFQPGKIGSSGVTTDAASGAGMVNVGDAWLANQKNKADYTGMVANAMINRHKEQMANEEGIANVTAAGIGAVGKAQMGAIKGKYMAKAGQQAENAAGIGAFAKVASAGLGLMFMSDETTKYDIQELDDALTTLRNLRPVSYRYLDEFGDPSRVHHGFIAQEYKEVLPDATYTDGETGKYCIDTVDLIGILVRAVQQLEGRIAHLELERTISLIK